MLYTGIPLQLVSYAWVVSSMEEHVINIRFAAVMKYHSPGCGRSSIKKGRGYAGERVLMIQTSLQVGEEVVVEGGSTLTTY